MLASEVQPPSPLACGKLAKTMSAWRAVGRRVKGLGPSGGSVDLRLFLVEVPEIWAAWQSLGEERTRKGRADPRVRTQQVSHKLAKLGSPKKLGLQASQVRFRDSFSLGFFVDSLGDVATVSSGGEKQGARKLVNNSKRTRERERASRDGSRD